MALGSRAVLEALLGLLAPPRCLACRRIAAECSLGDRLCELCRAELAAGPALCPVVPGLATLLAACRYEGPALGVVAALKRGLPPTAAETAADLLAERLGPGPPAPLPSALVPVPASRGRRLRGTDPAAALALALGRRLGCPVRFALRRNDRGRQQGRRRAERVADPPRFAVLAPPPPDAVLVDDVVTTGATLAACAAALKAAGTPASAAWALAATPRAAITAGRLARRRRIGEAPEARRRRRP